VHEYLGKWFEGADAEQRADDDAREIAAIIRREFDRRFKQCTGGLVD
jgi:hypothetical protein